MADMSLADVAAIAKDKDGFLEGNGIIILILFFLIFGFGGNWGGNSNALTQADMQSGFQNNAVLTKLDSITAAQYTNAYENANLFATLNTNMNNGFNSVNQNLCNISHQIDQGVCALKTQMLQDKYDAAQNQLNLAEIASANAVQTQNILNALGKYYTNPSVNPYTCYGGCGCSN